ncbi:MAG: bifunctional demethylmenaquinone methyltransferase/2-methoxy-6-polyprenyl-1,4-benzoquinol methylase UbiE [Calditrichia bacterium]
MFDRIAGRYDLLNRLLSFRQDVRWRKMIARHLPDLAEPKLLDVATGTADVILTLMQQRRHIRRAVGVDMARQMLAFGREKVLREEVAVKVDLIPADAAFLPFKSGSFDVVTISFGIRNVLHLNKALKEFFRVLTPRGRLLVLEFSLPQNRLIKTGYLFYFRHILPRLGGAISGDNYAYRYLNETAETFPYGRDFCLLLEEAGFADVKALPLTFGVATLYVADKKQSEANG